MSGYLHCFGDMFWNDVCYMAPSPVEYTRDFVGGEYNV
jgi:hypothetical protein